MERDSEVVVLRLGHRPGRDNRMTTHVGLTARALGADRVILAGRASDSKETIEDVEESIRADHESDPVLLVVGAEKVSFDVYERADYNVGVTNQPHSEVAGLAVFLDRLFEGEELDREWADATHRVVPKATGKKVEPVDED